MRLQQPRFIYLFSKQFFSQHPTVDSVSSSDFFFEKFVRDLKNYFNLQRN